jgi:hypothetical protein
MDTVHIRMSSHINSGASNSNDPHLPTGPPPAPRHRPGVPPPWDQNKYATSARPLPRRPVSSSLLHGHARRRQQQSYSVSPLPHSASLPRLPVCLGRMKVTVASRSGRELVKGGIDLKDSVCCVPSLPPARPSLRPLGLLWGLGLVPSGRGRFSVGVPDPLQRFLPWIHSWVPFAGQGR